LALSVLTRISHRAGTLLGGCRTGGASAQPKWRVRLPALCQSDCSFPRLVGYLLYEQLQGKLLAAYNINQASPGVPGPRYVPLNSWEEYTRRLWRRQPMPDALRTPPCGKKHLPGPNRDKLRYTLGRLKATRQARARNQKVSSGGRAVVLQPNLVKSLEERHRWACCFVFWEQFPSAC
jgi:hypothetical protein